MNGIELIAKERARQIDEEGWDPKHDDEHSGGELAAAASAYVLLACDQTYPEYRPEDFEKKANNRLSYAWPFEDEWWKPSPDPVRNLEKAAALIAAEIDRLQRAKGEE